MRSRKLGLARAVGVSHYDQVQLQSLISLGIGIPAVNQCELRIGQHDDVTIHFCQAHGITYEAYGALRSVDLDDQLITAIAGVHNVSAAQVALRWVTQLGCPAAVSPGLREDYPVEDLFLGGFSLSAKEMSRLSAL